jgi:hypothetical protein
MSLISEALKRARLEAARRDGQERRAVYTEAPAYTPRKRAFGRGRAVALVLTGLLAGGALAAGFFFASRGNRAPGAREVAPVPPPPASRVAATPAQSTPGVAPPTLGELLRDEKATVTQSGEPTAGVPARTAPSAPQPEPAPPAAQTAPRTAASTPAAPKPAPAAPNRRFENGGTYLRSVALPGGQRLELDGIVASATEPMTMINRQLVGIGETVDGFRIEAIEANQVTLRGVDGLVVHLRLREPRQ